MVKELFVVKFLKKKALEMFKDDEYKLDLISNLKDGTITCYSQGDFN